MTIKEIFNLQMAKSLALKNTKDVQWIALICKVIFSKLLVKKRIGCLLSSSLTKKVTLSVLVLKLWKYISWLPDIAHICFCIQNKAMDIKLCGMIIARVIEQKTIHILLGHPVLTRHIPNYSLKSQSWWGGKSRGRKDHQRLRTRWLRWWTWRQSWVPPSSWCLDYIPHGWSTPNWQ